MTAGNGRLPDNVEVEVGPDEEVRPVEVVAAEEPDRPMPDPMPETDGSPASPVAGSPELPDAEREQLEGDGDEGYLDEVADRLERAEEAPAVDSDGVERERQDLEPDDVADAGEVLGQ